LFTGILFREPLFTGPLTVDRLTIPIANLPLNLQGLRIVQLSDFHYDGQRLSDRLLEQTIDRVNQLDADLICLTGDYITYDPAPMVALAQQLKRLRSRSGIYAVLGNHDSYHPEAEPLVLKALARANIQPLVNEVVYPFGPGLAIVGLADYWSDDFSTEILTSLDPNCPRLVLSHNPDSAARLVDDRVDLQLSGHSHGGQISWPGFAPVPAWGAALYRQLPVALQRRAGPLRICAETLRNWDWASGLHWVGNNRLYVNRGLGTYAPGRLHCPPEITVITLSSQP
jgi:uncharacterized protein